MSRQAALQIAAFGDDEEAKRALIASIAHTERNFILKKGETTVDLKQHQIERTSDIELLKEIKNLLSQSVEKFRVVEVKKMMPLHGTPGKLAD